MMTRNKTSKPTTVPVNGQLLREQRISKGLSQVELAELAHIGTTTLSKMESGGAVRPSIVKLIATKIGLTYQDLVAIKSLDLDTSGIESGDAPAAGSGVRSISFQSDGRGRITVLAVFDVEYLNDVNQASKLLKSIAKFLKFQDEYEDEGVISQRGSLRVAFRPTRHDAILLMGAFILEELKRFKLVSLLMYEGWPPTFSSFDKHLGKSQNEVANFSEIEAPID